MYAKSGTVLAHRRQSTVSEELAIMGRKTSGSSAGSIPLDQARGSNEPLYGTRSNIPTSIPYTEPTPEIYITIQCKTSSDEYELNPDDSGEIFYQRLETFARKRFRHELNRDSDRMRLATDQDTFECESYTLSLKEKRIEVSWKRALTWFNKMQAKGPHEIYAFIESDDG